jgi:hypothetical protein
MSLDTQGAPTAASPTAEKEDETQAAAATVEATDATPAGSSPADEQDAKPDLLSVVRDAIKPEDKKEADPSAAEGKGEAAAAAEAEAKPEGEANAESEAEADAKLPFHEHPRWKQVIAERNGFAEDAGRFRQIDGFMQEHGLSPAEVAEGFDIMAKLKSGDPANLAEVREYFANNLAVLDNALGRVLPDDLQQRVDSGALDEEAAQELAQARANERLRTQATEARRTEETRRTERQNAETNATASANAVQEWEARTKAADPDYARKAELVETTVRAIVMETGKAPTNPEEAVKLAEQAYERVNKQLKAVLPAKKPIAPDPRGSSAPIKNAPPTSLRDAVNAALNRS